MLIPYHNVVIKTVTYPLNRNVYIHGSSPCAYDQLVNLGFPDIKVVHLLKGSDHTEKLKNWLAENWLTNRKVLKELAEIKKATDDTVQTVAVKSRAAQKAYRGVLQFIIEHRNEIDSISNLVIPDKTLGGTEPPVASKVFNNMSYFERQRIMKQNLQRVEEVTEQPIEPSKLLPMTYSAESNKN